MKCTRCKTTMHKNGTRNGKQRYKCSVCGYEIEKSISNNILVIPDLHIPFEHPNALRFVSDLKKEYDCSTIVQIGDLTDQYCFSRYAHDPDALNARQEVTTAKIRIVDWVSEFPELIYITGNHCMRLQKRIYEIGIPPDLVVKTFNDIFGIPKSWIQTKEMNMNGITFLHGSRTSENAHILTAKSYHNSIVMGHTHSTLAVNWMTGVNGKLFACNCGSLVDQKTYAFYYAKDLVNKSTMGAVVIIDGRHPFVIPME